MRRGLVRSASGTRLGAAASRGQCTRSGAITLPLFEIALVLVRLDHVARLILNQNHKILLFTLSSPRSPCSEKH
jgi:hypothetical protein